MAEWTVGPVNWVNCRAREFEGRVRYLKIIISVTAPRKRNEGAETTNWYFMGLSVKFCFLRKLHFSACLKFSLPLTKSKCCVCVCACGIASVIIPPRMKSPSDVLPEESKTIPNKPQYTSNHININSNDKKSQNRTCSVVFLIWLMSSKLFNPLAPKILLKLHGCWGINSVVQRMLPQMKVKRPHLFVVVCTRNDAIYAPKDAYNSIRK
jgi:hypothetical protein